jgi:hypothetical protein
VFLEAGIFDWIFGVIPDVAIVSTILFILGWLAKRFVKPLLEVERNRAMATWIAHIADEVTDELVARYPDQQWDNWLDKAVDKVMEVCEIEKREVAERAARAALGRKAVKNG